MGDTMPEDEPVRTVRTVCPAHCGIDACGILAHVRGDRVVKVEPASFPDPKDRRICLRGLSSLELTYHPDRLKHPMRRVGERGEGRFERISWDQALDFVAERFQDIAARHGWPAIAWTLGGPGSGTTKFGAYLRLASLTRSTRVSAWGYGDAGLPCGSRVIFGTQFPYPYLFGPLQTGRADPDVLVVWGTNPAESQPLNLMRRIMDAKARGTRLVVIDPRYTVTASKSDQYVGLRPGTDVALALGLIHVLFREGLQDDAFLLDHTVAPYLVRSDTGRFVRGRDLGEGAQEAYVVWDRTTGTPRPHDAPGVEPEAFGRCTVNGTDCKTALQLLRELAGAYPPERVSKITGVSADLVVRLAGRIGRSPSTLFITHMGLTRTYHGDVSLRALATVAAVTGNIHSSAEGGHRYAVLNWTPFLKAVPDQPSYRRLGILQLYDAVISGNPYPVKAVWFSFINFLNQCAHSGKIAEKMFSELELIVDTELFMTPTARYADILLPVCSYLEFSDLIPQPYPYVQLQQKVIEPLHESRSDVDIAAGLARRLGLGAYFEGGEEAFIDLLLDSGHDSVRGITRENLMQGPMRSRPASRPDRGSGLSFKTPSGKMELYAEQLVEEGQALPVYLEPLETPVTGAGRYPLAFVQGHTRFRTHSMFANAPSLLEMNPKPFVEMSPRDAAPRRISEGDLVTVFNDRARTTLRVRLTEGVRPGVVNIHEGWWIDQFREGSVNHLTHDVINPVQEKVYEPNMHMNDVAVEVVRAEE